jgi:hypothetical protein
LDFLDEKYLPRTVSANKEETPQIIQDAHFLSGMIHSKDFEDLLQIQA